MEYILTAVFALHLLASPIQHKVYKMRITGYHVKANERGALAEIVRPGRHAAVSPGCIELLGEKVYVKGYGVYRVNDITSDELDVSFGICTLDIAKGTLKEAMAVGADTATVVRIPPKEK